MVRDLALIEKSDVEFGPGLNILTGETGAGKSILLGSIQLALGQKAGKDIIRHGKEQALVTLSFSLTGEEEEALRLLEDDLEIEEGTLLIKRKITEKKSETRVNDVPVTLSKLREMSGTLLDLHGQYEHYSLLKEGAYLSIVDAYLSGKGENMLSAARNAFLRYKERKELLAEYNLPEEERLRELDFLDFAISELREASL